MLLAPPADDAFDAVTWSVTSRHVTSRDPLVPIPLHHRSLCPPPLSIPLNPIHACNARNNDVYTTSSIAVFKRRSTSLWAPAYIFVGGHIQRPNRHGIYVYVNGRVTITTENTENGAIALSRMNFSGYVERVTIFS